jgi:hypothetical protein
VCSRAQRLDVCATLFIKIFSLAILILASTLGSRVSRFRENKKKKAHKSVRSVRYSLAKGICLGKAREGNAIDTLGLDVFFS